MKLSGEDVDMLLERFDQTDPKLQRRIMARFAANNYFLLSACEYVAGSFAQVPSDQTVPPIVLHNCREKLEEAIKMTKEPTDE